jgi:hypothetical protein
VSVEIPFYGMRRSGFAHVWSRSVFELGGRAAGENDNHNKKEER